MAEMMYFKSTEIAEKTWMIQNAFTVRTPALSYLVEGDDYAVMIDTMMGWGNLRAYAETLTEKPIKLLNTHFHLDHTGGNFDFDSCYMHYLDISELWASPLKTARDKLEAAKEAALPEFRELLTIENFHDEVPVIVFPIYDGDIFDLGGRKLKTVYVGGHTPGTVVFIDDKTGICFSGDACNLNTLLCFEDSLPVEAYLKNLLHFKKFQSEIRSFYGGHSPETELTLIDEAISTAADVVAGRDDHERADNMFGRTVYYAARRTPGSYTRADGGHFNMCYLAGRVEEKEYEPHVIGLRPELPY